MHACIHIYIHTHTYTHTYTYIHTYICIFTYTRIPYHLLLKCTVCYLCRDTQIRVGGNIKKQVYTPCITDTQTRESVASCLCTYVFRVKFSRHWGVSYLNLNDSIFCDITDNTFHMLACLDWNISSETLWGYAWRMSTLLTIETASSSPACCMWGMLG